MGHPSVRANSAHRGRSQIERVARHIGETCVAQLREELSPDPCTSLSGRFFRARLHRDSNPAAGDQVLTQFAQASDGFWPEPDRVHGKDRVERLTPYGAKRRPRVVRRTVQVDARSAQTTLAAVGAPHLLQARRRTLARMVPLGLRGEIGEQLRARLR